MRVCPQILVMVTHRTGDFIHKIVSGSGASGSNCFAVRDV